MENASRALLMAAGVLIGMLILSLAVYLFVSFGSTSAEIHKQNASQQIVQFNSQFISYEEKECTIYDVVTVANLATENNKYYEFPLKTTWTEGKDNYISVELKNFDNPKLRNYTFIEGSSTSDRGIEYDDIIRKDLEGMQEKTDEKGNLYKALTQYECKTHINQTTQRVDYVKFSKTDQ